jgi:hypothetical protein
MSSKNTFKHPRPTVTLFLFAYKQEAYVRKACEAALAQTYEPLEIIFSDDCSPDNTFQMMQSVAAQYTGPHTVKLNQNKSNLGLIKHVNLSHQLASGQLLVAAAGDDESVPHRVSELVHAYMTYEGDAPPCSIHSAVRKMTVAGVLEDVMVPPILNVAPNDMCLSLGLCIGATHAWSRKTFDVFGDIVQLNTFEDLAINYRSFLLDGIAYIDKPLVNYRVGNGMSTPQTDPLQEKIRVSHIAIAIYEQRLMDLHTINQAQSKDVQRLQHQLAIERARLAIYTRSEKTHVLLWRSFEGGIFKKSISALWRRWRLGF